MFFMELLETNLVRGLQLNPSCNNNAENLTAPIFIRFHSMTMLEIFSVSVYLISIDKFTRFYLPYFSTNGFILRGEAKAMSINFFVLFCFFFFVIVCDFLFEYC